MIYQNQRWQTFRINKEIIVDEWLECKRKQRIAEFWTKAAAVMAAIKKIKKEFDDEYLRHQIKMKSVYMAMRIFQEARKKILRQAQWEHGYTYRERREREDVERRL